MKKRTERTERTERNEGNGKKRKAARKTFPFFLFLSVLSVLAAARPPAAFADFFSPAQIQFLFDPQNGAESKAQRFYHYFKKDRDPALVVPAWVDQVLPAMLNHPVWQDPQEGVLDEARVWQDPAAVLYEFFELTRKTLSPQDGGQLELPSSLTADYEDNHVRFQMAMDRLYRARLEDSLAGRGRAVMSSFALIDKEMGSVVTALTNEDFKSYRQAVVGVGVLTAGAFGDLNAPPPGYAPPNPPETSPAATAVFLGVLGTAVMALCGWLLGSLNEESIKEASDKYRAKVKEWAYEYQRQFLTVKINYLIGAPILFGFIVGLLTFNIFGFLIFFGMGTYAGLILPGWLLKHVRFLRGVKCEKQLMDAIILMSNGLKSGVDLVQCIAMVQKDLPPPISDEFGLCLKNYQLGTSLEKALEGMEERVQSRLLSYLIKSIVIQRTSGGNLTKIFDRIVENIREETKLVEKTSALTSQQRIQAIVVGIMPWVMMFVMFVFQPKTMAAFYFTPRGLLIIILCAAWIAAGMRVVNKIGDIQV